MGDSPGVLLRTGTMAGTVMAGPVLEGGAACSNMRLTWNCSSFSRSAVLRMGPAEAQVLSGWAGIKEESRRLQLSAY